jgi:hypothetical protein
MKPTKVWRRSDGYMSSQSEEDEAQKEWDRFVREPVQGGVPRRVTFDRLSPSFKEELIERARTPTSDDARRWTAHRQRPEHRRFVADRTYGTDSSTEAESDSDQQRRRLTYSEALRREERRRPSQVGPSLSGTARGPSAGPSRGPSIGTDRGPSTGPSSGPSAVRPQSVCQRSVVNRSVDDRARRRLDDRRPPNELQTTAQFDHRNPSTRRQLPTSPDRRHSSVGHQLPTSFDNRRLLDDRHYSSSLLGRRPFLDDRLTELDADRHSIIVGQRPRDAADASRTDDDGDGSAIARSSDNYERRMGGSKAKTRRRQRTDMQIGTDYLDMNDMVTETGVCRGDLARNKVQRSGTADAYTDRRSPPFYDCRRSTTSSFNHADCRPRDHNYQHRPSISRPTTTRYRHRSPQYDRHQHSNMSASEHEYSRSPLTREDQSVSKKSGQRWSSEAVCGSGGSTNRRRPQNTGGDDGSPSDSDSDDWRVVGPRRHGNRRDRENDRRRDQPQRSGPVRQGQIGGRRDRRRSRRPSRYSSTSSDDRDDVITAKDRRNFIRPQKFSGTGSFETFYAHFRNCAKYNRWDDTDQLAHLKACLIGEAGQILWDTSSSDTNSLDKMKKLLSDRFGGARMSEKYRMELKLRRRRPNETLTALHQDIRRLMALAHPDLQHDSRETIAVDFFIDAIDDADFALKVRERVPKKLDEALCVALQLEAWSKNATRIREQDSYRYDDNERNRKPKTRNVAEKSTEIDQLASRLETALCKIVENCQKSVPAEVANKAGQLPTAAVGGPTTALDHGGRSQGPTNNRPLRWPNRSNDRPMTCYGCGQVGHFKFQCPNRKEEDAAPGPDRPSSNGQTRVIGGLDKHSVYINCRLAGKPIVCLLDTGCELTIVPKELLRGVSGRLEPSTHELTAANGTKVEVLGEIVLPLTIGKRRFPTRAVVSPDVEELMLGIDWLSKYSCVWDFCGEQLIIDGQECRTSTRKGARKCRRMYVQNEVIVPARKETEVTARSTLIDVRQVSTNSMVETRRLSSGVYVGRMLLPAAHRNLTVRIVNTTAKDQRLPADFYLGNISSVSIVHDEGSKADKPADHEGRPPCPTPAASTRARTVKARTVHDQVDGEPSVIEKLLKDLPTELTHEQRSQVEALLTRYVDTFSRDEYDVGHTDLVEHYIDTGSHRPIRQQLRRHPIAQLDIIDRQVEDMLEHEFIEPAASPWASNVVLVRKKNGNYRFCVDYRGVNSVTYQDTYPLPHIETCLSSLDGSTWFSTLDLRAGYHNISICESDRDKTAFITRRGCWRYKVLPFGLTCAPSVFQRLMDLVLCGLSYETCMVYLDDIIVYATDFQEHLQRLEQIFERLRSANLKLHPDKCCLLRRKVAFLGHVVSADGIEVQDAKVEAVRQWPTPRNLHETRQFLGLCSYYRRFVEGFADIAAPLHALARKDMRFQWTDACQEAFDTMKERLTSAPILGMPRTEGQFILDTDASDKGLGVVLSQEQDGREVVLAYGSRLLTRTERDYCVTKKELLAAVYGLKTYRQYLLGRSFILRTDHSALKWLRRTPEPLAQQARWLSFIEQFGPFEIRHRPGVRHGNADAMSRRPGPCRQCTHCNETDEEENGEVRAVKRWHKSRPNQVVLDSQLTPDPCPTTSVSDDGTRQQPLTSHDESVCRLDYQPPTQQEAQSEVRSEQSIDRTSEIARLQKELDDEEGIRDTFQYCVDRWFQYAHRDKCHELYKKRDWKGRHPPPRNHCRGFPCPCTQEVSMEDLDLHIRSRQETLQICRKDVTELQQKLSELVETSAPNSVTRAVLRHRRTKGPSSNPKPLDTPASDQGGRSQCSTSVSDAVLEQEIDEVPEEQMARLQREDPDIGPIIRLREESEQQPQISVVMTESEATKLLWSQWDMLTTDNGLLFRQLPAKYDRPAVKQLLIPTVAKTDIMKRSHTGMCAGHLGLRKTLEQVRRRAYWSGWRKDVTRFCRRCDACNRYCRGRPRKSAALQPIASGAPWERLSIDLTGPHPRSKRGSKFVLTCTDHWSKWSEAFAIPNKEAVTVARVLTEQVFCRLGVPLSILSDQGTEVDSSVMKELCRLLDIEKMHTSTYQPKCNSKVERFHSTFNSMMAKVIEEDQSNWDRWIPYVLAAYQSTQHESTGYSPNYLILGREVRAGIDVIYGSMPTFESVDPDSYVEEVEKRRRAAYCLVRQQLHKTAERNRRYYNVGIRPRTFQVGDKVYYFSPRRLRGKQMKWRRRRTGPLEIVKLIGPVNALIQKSKKTRPFVVHLDKLTPYFDKDTPSSDDEQKRADQNEEMGGEVSDGLGAVVGWPDGSAGREERPHRTMQKPARFRN